jgi:hypothetical protein
MGLAKLSTATNFKLSGVEHFVGTANADYIVVNNLGMTITGGLGADEIILDSGHDTVVFTDAETDASDIVKQFTAGSDTLDVGALLGYTDTTGDVEVDASTDNVVFVTSAAELTELEFEAEVTSAAAGADDLKKILVVQHDGTNAETDFDAKVYLVDADGATLIAVIGVAGDGALVVGDFA